MRGQNQRKFAFEKAVSVHSGEKSLEEQTWRWEMVKRPEGGQWTGDTRRGNPGCTRGRSDRTWSLQEAPFSCRRGHGQ